MKNENGVTLLALVITLTVMAIIGLTVVFTAEGIDAKVDDDILIAELKTVQHIVLQEWNKKITLGDDYTLKGDPIINSNDTTDELGAEQNKLNQGVETEEKRITFKRKPINEERYYEYYKLTPANFKELGAENVSSDYIVCYETGEVANITKYKTSDGEPLYTR